MIWLLILLLIVLLHVYVIMMNTNSINTNEHFVYYPNCMETVFGNLRCFPYSRFYYPLFPWTYFNPYY